MFYPPLSTPGFHQNPKIEWMRSRREIEKFNDGITGNNHLHLKS